MKKKYITRLSAFLLVLLLGITSVSFPSQAKPKTSGMNVQYHSQKDIRKFVKNHKFDTNSQVSYAKKPSVKPSSYRAGELKKSSLNQGLKALNTMRYIAGVPANVKLDKSYNKACQAAALTNAANHELSHFPQRPNKMPDDLYKLGHEGAGSSNLAMTSWPCNLAYNVVWQWMADDDAGNIDRVGHRRWVLNPSMKKTGFGYVNNYAAMYAFDGNFTDTQYYGVAWPAQNMPIEYFSDSMPWSISMGKPVEKSKIKVTLTRKRGKKTKKWTFGAKKSNGYFNVENSYYGQQGCIIFRPKNISYRAGDTFNVKITGLDETVSYQVKFFKL